MNHLSIDSERVAFIFDLDGTLFDSASQIMNCANSVRDGLGAASLSEQQALKVIGLPAFELFADLNLGEAELADAIRSFRLLLHKEIQRKNTLYPGSLELLEGLAASGFLVGIATSKPQFLADAVVSNSTIASLVQHVQGTDGFLPKPSPEVILRCCKALGATKAVMIGDRTEDIRAGVAAGVMTVGLSQTFHDEQELEQAGADCVFGKIADFGHNLEEIVSRLKGIL